MAQIFIAGNVAVIQMSVSLENLKLLEKYRPDSLRLKDEDGNVKFAVGTGSSSINKNGASFNEATLDEKKAACVTVHIPSGTEDAEKYVADYIGVAFLELQKIEAGLQEEISAVEADMRQIKESIKHANSEHENRGDRID